MLSAARGDTVYRKKREAPDLVGGENKAELEKLSFLIVELNHEKDGLAKQNHDLQNQVRSLENRKQIEDVLRKSNIALANECERLKSEKEELTLKLNKPLVKIKAKTTKIAVKEVNRKPKRVSKKGK